MEQDQDREQAQAQAAMFTQRNRHNDIGAAKKPMYPLARIDLHKCFCCGKEPPPTQHPIRCKSCLVAVYCSARCQVDHWDREHRSVCLESCVRREECHYCRKPYRKCKEGLLLCERCKVTKYCSADCQHKHWYTGHRGRCALLALLQKTISALEDQANISGGVLVVALAGLCKCLCDERTVRAVTSFWMGRCAHCDAGVSEELHGPVAFLMTECTCGTYRKRVASHSGHDGGGADEHVPVTIILPIVTCSADCAFSICGVIKV